jgi:hypothetical protein
MRSAPPATTRPTYPDEPESAPAPAWGRGGAGAAVINDADECALGRLPLVLLGWPRRRRAYA